MLNPRKRKEVAYERKAFRKTADPFRKEDGSRKFPLLLTGDRCYYYRESDTVAAARLRPGRHRHALPDFTEFLDFMAANRRGEPTAEPLLITPYPALSIDVDWERVKK